jgi:hypothetical protein
MLRDLPFQIPHDQRQTSGSCPKRVTASLSRGLVQYNYNSSEHIHGGSLPALCTVSFNNYWHSKKTNPELWEGYASCRSYTDGWRCSVPKPAKTVHHSLSFNNSTVLVFCFTHTWLTVFICPDWQNSTSIKPFNASARILQVSVYAKTIFSMTVKMLHKEDN